MRPTLARAALAAVLASGCAGGADRRGLSALEEERRPTGPPVLESFTQEEQAFMKEGLHQFSANDPAWEATRARWLAMGPAQADFLVRTMWAGLLKAQAVNRPELVERARHELGRGIGEPAIALSAQFLAGGTVYSTTDAETGEKRDVAVDDFTRREASEILSLVGAPAVPAVAQALETAPSKAGKRAALETLGWIGDRGGDAAAAPVIAHARGDDEVLRVIAVRALANFHDARTRGALLEALSDADELVRTKAAESLLARRDRAAAAEIRAAADRARSGGRLAEAAALERSASRVEALPK